jgi:hypothetical protein
MPIHPITDLHSLINELEKWRIEERTVSAVLVVLHSGGASVWVCGRVADTSELRLVIEGWGRASFGLAGAKFDAKLSPQLKMSIDDLQGRAPIDWDEAIALIMATGHTLVLWSERDGE